jgi:hypothetical protein
MGHLLKMSMKKDSLVSCPKLFLSFLQKGIDILLRVCYALAAITNCTLKIKQDLAPIIRR